MAKKKYDGPRPEEVLVQDLISLMESGQAPWRREWNRVQANHINFLTNHKYSGSNIILLEFGMCSKVDASLPFWCGAGEARKYGVFPKKGSKSVRIIRPQLNKVEEENDQGEVSEKTWTSFKIVPVFNVCDLQGEKLDELIDKAKIDNGLKDTKVIDASQRIASAEAVLDRWSVKLKHQGNRAFYNFVSDFIVLPEFESFHSPEAYYATRAHECVHSTGHKTRLDRDMSGDMSSKSYAFEELVAELGSVLLCNHLQISSNFSNHAAYLQSWISMLKEKPSVLFTALSASRKAVEFFVEKTSTQDPVDLEVTAI